MYRTYIPVSYTHLDVYKRQAYLSAPFSGNERAVVSKVCRKLLNKIIRPSLAVPYVVALGKRNLLWNLLPDHIEEHVLEVDHAE